MFLMLLVILLLAYNNMIKQDNPIAGQKSGKSSSLHTHIFVLETLWQLCTPQVLQWCYIRVITQTFQEALLRTLY